MTGRMPGVTQDESDLTIKRADIGPLAETAAEVLRRAETAELHAMWEALRGDRPAPFRAELDAAKIGAKAPYLAIFEHVGPSNFRIRIAGDRLNRWFGLELRGMSALSLAAAPGRNHLQAALNRVTAEPAAAVLHGLALGADGEGCGMEAILLPMRSDFGPVDRVLFGLWLTEPATPPAPFRLALEEIAVAPILAVAPERAAEAAPTSSGDDPAPAAETRSPAPRRGHLRLVKSDVPPPHRRK